MQQLHHEFCFVFYVAGSADLATKGGDTVMGRSSTSLSAPSATRINWGLAPFFLFFSYQLLFLPSNPVPSFPSVSLCLFRASLSISVTPTLCSLKAGWTHLLNGYSCEFHVEGEDIRCFGFEFIPKSKHHLHGLHLICSCPCH